MQKVASEAIPKAVTPRWPHPAETPPDDGSFGAASVSTAAGKTRGSSPRVPKPGATHGCRKPSAFWTPPGDEAALSITARMRARRSPEPAHLHPPWGHHNPPPASATPRGWPCHLFFAISALQAAEPGCPKPPCHPSWAGCALLPAVHRRERGKQPGVWGCAMHQRCLLSIWENLLHPNLLPFWVSAAVGLQQ